MAKPDLRAECVRLRVEDRLAYREIERKTGASRGSLSLWLRDYSLTAAEKIDRQGHLKQPRKPRPAPSKFFLAVRGQDMSRAQKARVAEAAVLFRLALHGFVPFGAAFDGEKTDWLVDTGDRLVRLQVKWVRWQNGLKGLPLVKLVCAEGHNGQRRYKKGELDFMVGYDLVSDTAFVWSWAEIGGRKRTITVTPDAAERWDKLRT